MELALAVLGVGAVAVVALVVSGFHWGKWKAKRDLLAIAEARQREATEALARPVPDGRELLDELQDADG